MAHARAGTVAHGVGLPPRGSGSAPDEFGIAEFAVHQHRLGWAEFQQGALQAGFAVLDSANPVGQQAQFDAVGDQAVVDYRVGADWAKGWVTTREVSDRHGGTITIPAPPWHFSGHDGPLTTQVPARQGEHNDEVLKELGLTADQIDALAATGALIEPARGVEIPQTP